MTADFGNHSPDLRARFFRALAELLDRSAAAPEALNPGRALAFLLKGPGREYLSAPAFENVSFARGIGFLCGSASVIDDMKLLSDLPDGIVCEENLAAPLAAALADRARAEASSHR